MEQKKPEKLELEPGKVLKDKQAATKILTVLKP